LLVLVASGCASGSMPDLDPAVLGDEAGPGTPLTTGAGAGTSSDPRDDDTGDRGDTGGTDPAGPADPDRAGSTSGVGDTGTSTGAIPDEPDTTDGGETDDGGSTGAPAPVALDLSGWTLVQTDSYRTLDLPPGTTLAAGGCVVIARAAGRVEFEAHWGALPPDVVFIDASTLGGDEFPVLNGGETFELVDAGGLSVDGPTPALAVEGNVQRVDGSLAADDVGAWLVSSDPIADATPGYGPAVAPGPVGVFISEVSDLAGTGNWAYEFVELHYAG
jgi:hypothetical protein